MYATSFCIEWFLIHSVCLTLLCTASIVEDKFFFALTITFIVQEMNRKQPKWLTFPLFISIALRIYFISTVNSRYIFCFNISMISTMNIITSVYRRFYDKVFRSHKPTLLRDIIFYHCYHIYYNSYSCSMVRNI